LEGGEVGSETIPVNPYEKLIMDLKDGADIEKNYTYTRTRLDGIGTEKIYCIDDISEVCKRKRLEEQQKKSEIKLLSEQELSEQNKLTHEHNKEVRKKEKEVIDKESEIITIIEAQISEKKKKVENLGISN